MTIKDNHHPPYKDYYDADPIDQVETDPIINFQRTKQIIMGIDALSHTPVLCNKFLHELNCNGLCQYNRSHIVYIFEISNHVDNSSHVLMFLKTSKCYIITPHTHKWYNINPNEILLDHKLALYSDKLAHMAPLPPAINAYWIIPRVTYYKLKIGKIMTTVNNPSTTIPH